VKSAMLFALAIACTLILSVGVATGSQQPSSSRNG